MDGHRTFKICTDAAGTNWFDLAVPSQDMPAADLVSCVRDRLGLVASDPLYFTRMPARGSDPDEAAVPLSPLLPDGTRLRLVRPPVASGGAAAERDGDDSERTDLSASHGDAHGLRGGDPPSQAGRAPRGAGCCSFLESREIPPSQALNVDLANERTLLAWCRTGLAVIRTVFSFATLQGLTKGALAVDVLVTIVLAFASVVMLLVGWQRFGAVRKDQMGDPSARRVSVLPVFSMLVAVAAICFSVSMMRQPLRFVRNLQEVGMDLLVPD